MLEQLSQGRHGVLDHFISQREAARGLAEDAAGGSLPEHPAG